ncbi:MAG: tripartite tricarboxylate transporter substrate binding protein [Treponema sp.]|nr:tripartite tricarboxylate transporter substrate binding protein [Treponema sp.]MBR4463797.1 tripartite tricarboxylate transporter substrate binding protein [Treponema sp.]
MKKILMVAAVAAMAASLFTGCKKKAATESVSADWKPNGTVTMIVAYKAGSGTDNTARVLTSYAEKYVGQTLVIDNKEGGSGSIGWTALAKAKPDGLTLGFINLPTFCSNIIDHLGSYTVESIEPIANHVIETSVVLVSAKSKFNTLQELVDYARANPGTLKASTNGNKASNHIGAQLLAHSANFEYTAIPYGGTADQLLALRQDEVDFSVAKVADFTAFASEVKVLGTYDSKRLAEYPDAPTLGELGFYPYWYGSARCIVAPAGTPKPIIDFYANAFKQAMEDPEYIAASEKAHMTTEYKSPEDTGDLINQQYNFCTNTLTEIFN